MITRPEPPATTTGRAPWWGVLAIVGAAGVAYHNSFHGPFVFDDESSIVTNPTIRSMAGALSPPTTNVTAQGRPILNLSLAVNYALGGTAVAGYHALNLIIHALAGLTLFGIVRRVGVAAGTPAATHATPLALAVALLWIVHPLQTESVTYIIQRAESLVGLFYLLTIYCFVRAVGQVSDLPLSGYAGGSKTRPTFWLALAILACLLGMATKEVMATAPLMVLFLDRTFFAGTFGGALRRRPGFYAALAATWLLLAWLVAQAGGNRGGSVGFGVGIGWWDYWLTQFKAISHYLRLSFWPQPLVFEYGAFWIRDLSEIAVPVLVVVGLLAATLSALWRRSRLGILGVWFFGILAPTSLAPGTTQMIVEHRMYLPLAAVIVVGVVGVRAVFAARRRVAKGVLAAIVIALTALTIRRNEDYGSDVALWSDTVAKAPKNPLAHFMLADAQERAGNLAAALAGYERTLALKPNFSIGHEKLGELLFKQSRSTEAIEHFETALRLQPDYADAHANLGNALLTAERPADAVPHLEKAVRLMPDSGFARYNLGNALTGLGRSSEAIPHYEAAVRANPDLVEAQYNLANALAASGRQRDAIAHYEAALRVRPGYTAAHHNLGSALFELGRLAEAAQHYETTLRLSPDFPNARANLERVRAHMQRK